MRSRSWSNAGSERQFAAARGKLFERRRALGSRLVYDADERMWFRGRRDGARQLSRGAGVVAHGKARRADIGCADGGGARAGLVLTRCRRRTQLGACWRWPRSPSDDPHRRGGFCTLPTPNSAAHSARYRLVCRRATRLEVQGHLDELQRCARVKLRAARWGLGRTAEAQELFERRLTMRGGSTIAGCRRSRWAISERCAREAVTWRRARRFYDEALTYYMALNIERPAASIAGNLAEIEFAAGDVDAALHRAEEARAGHEPGTTAARSQTTCATCRHTSSRWIVSTTRSCMRPRLCPSRARSDRRC